MKMEDTFYFIFFFLCSVFQEKPVWLHIPAVMCIYQLKQAEALMLSSIIRDEQRNALFFQPIQGSDKSWSVYMHRRGGTIRFPFFSIFIRFLSEYVPSEIQPLLFQSCRIYHAVLLALAVLMWELIEPEKRATRCFCCFLCLWSYKPSQWCRSVLSGGSPGGSSLKVQIRISC